MTSAELEAELEALHSRSFGWALSCCRWDESQAEDVLQTTYVKVLSGSASFGGRSAFSTWLFGVIRRTAQEMERSARSQHKKALKFAAVGGLPDAEPAVAERQIVRSEESRRLRGALEHLPDRQREVLFLVFYQDLSVAQSAEVMDISVGSARTHYDRGKKRLRALLAEEKS